VARKAVYTPEDKAKALAVLRSCNGKVNQAARLLGIPRRTLAYWNDGSGVGEVSQELIREKHSELKASFDSIASRLTGVIGMKLGQLERDQQALAKTGTRDLAIAAGIATEKALLLAGNPTRITETRSEAARYESAIKLMIEECTAKGYEIDRTEAIKLLSIHLPEINEYVN